MKQNQLYEQFDKFPLSIIEQKFNYKSLENLNNRKVLEKIILDYYRPTLIYLINEKRVNGELKGNTPEERYDYFNRELCGSGKIFGEIEIRFPEINDRIEMRVKKYLDLHELVKSIFVKDFRFLCDNNFLDSDKSAPDLDNLEIEVTGDIHDGMGVCIITYNNQKVVYKRKSSTPSKFLHKIDLMVSGFFNKEIHFIPNILDRDGYFWEQYINNQKLNNANEAREYYMNMGFLLFYAYIFNISDLHFENIISSGKSPILVDVETLFSTSPFEIIADNLATKEITQRSRSSVLSSGLLPISEAEKIFGGDLSGILGGTLVNEFKTVINNYRDDIRIEKVIQATKYQSHLPFFEHLGQKEYLVATNYVNDIIEGFKLMSDFFLNHKEEILEVYQQYSDLRTRILFRNTHEYDVVSQLLISPIYSQKQDLLFKKMSEKLSHYDSSKLCESEVRQLLSMDIPSFYIEANSIMVTDGYSDVWKIRETPLYSVTEKLNKLTEDKISEQVELIRFSLQADSDSESTEMQELYRKYDDFRNEENILINALNNLVDEILAKMYLDPDDESINWMTLKVNDHNNFELVPMDNSIYDGISGVALSLIECYSLLDENRKRKVYRCLCYLFKTLVNVYSNVLDMTYYVGKLGILSTLVRISQITKQEIPQKILNSKVTLIKQALQNTPADFLTGFSSSILACEDDEYSEEFLRVMIKRFEELKQDDSNNNYIYWGKEESNNVSLAHGNAGIEISLLYLAGKLNSRDAKKMYEDAKKFDDKQKLDQGWVDKRFSDSNAQWCHGSTGVLISRLAQLKLNQEFKILSIQEESLLVDDIQHAIKQIISIGFDMNNFTLCHGVGGNLLALTYYNNLYGGENSSELEKIINSEYRKMLSFGIKYGWMCSFNTNFDSYGLMTGLAGIVYSVAKYLKSDSSLEILTPVF